MCRITRPATDEKMLDRTRADVPKRIANIRDKTAAGAKSVIGPGIPELIVSSATETRAVGPPPSAGRKCTVRAVSGLIYPDFCAA